MKKFIFFTMITLTTLSCEDNFLDRAPFDSLSSTKVWISDKNAQTAVDGIYSSFARGAMYNFYYYITNIGPDGFAWVRGGAGLTQAQGQATAQDDIFLSQYYLFYRTIRYANDAIANLPNNFNLTLEKSERMLGEAKFLRGLCYFYLWDLYGGVILLDKPVNPSETYLPRNTAEEVKNFVIKDFTDAIELLPVSYPVADNGRVTKGAAITMLGKTYLYDKQWDKAAEQLGKLMNSPYSYKLVDDYAEAKNETSGPTVDVYNAVKQIRSRAGLVDLPGGLSKDDMRHNIWLERFRELIGEGTLYFDVIRWRTASTNDPIFGLNHDVLDFRGMWLFTKVFIERDFLWPIPALEIQINTKLTQNPGW